LSLDSSACKAGDDLIAELTRIGSDVPCNEELILFEQGELPCGLYILHEGEALLTMKRSDGELVLQMTATQGSLLGLPGVVGDMPYTLAAKAKKGARVSFVPKDKFSELMLKEPVLAVQVLQVLAAELRAARSGFSRH
jgi:CRP/FNR family transcriptional regulator, polysaccharide utilization system transcription regulator